MFKSALRVVLLLAVSGLTTSAAGYILDPPWFSDEHGGHYIEPFILVMTNPNAFGTIYYTFDGEDPRDPDGGISASAVGYSGPIDLTESTHVRARVYYANDWSDIKEVWFFIHYYPTPVIVVDASAPYGSDGMSWPHAYTCLADALNDPALAYGYSILVAEGTYRPDENTNDHDPIGTGDRTDTFALMSGVALYGGFPSGGGGFEDRDPNQYETILSGDINVPGDNTDNSYHVVTASGTDSNSILDGFTITAGNANGSGANGNGGGMFNGNSSPTVTNCTFSGSVAKYGGGMYNGSNSSPKVTNCTFSGNSAYERGGGMFNGNSSPKVTNCTFSSNSASSDGGGMYNIDSSSPTLTNCTLSGNNAQNYGGGMYNLLSGPTLANCIIWGNVAPTGSQIYNNTSFPVVNYCDVQGGYGGAGNIDAEPLFVDADGPDDIAGTEDDNLRLLHDSPCIDAGDPNYSDPNYPTDLDGHTRIVDGDCDTTEIVDMGAYEFGWVYIGDFAGGCDVDFKDFAVFALAWLTEEGDGQYNPVCDISLSADSFIDGMDLKIFTDNWLAGK